MKLKKYLTDIFKNSFKPFYQQEKFKEYSVLWVAKSEKIRVFSGCLILFLVMAFVLCSTTATADITLTKSTVYATDVPDNSSLIVALYSGSKLMDTKIYSGSESITADYADDLSNSYENSDSVKVFLWELETLTPLMVCSSGTLDSLPEDLSDSKAITVYFSCTGNTEALAQKVIAASDSDSWEIVPMEPYTDEDLDYTNSNCRANLEQNDPTARPAISGAIENIDDYDTILLGYPIWWGTIPKIINTFIDTYDLSGKTIMPFCTSGGSGIASSVNAIKSACPDANVTTGYRGTSSTTEEDILMWLTNNGYT